MTQHHSGFDTDIVLRLLLLLQDTGKWFSSFNAFLAEAPVFPHRRIQ